MQRFFLTVCLLLITRGLLAETIVCPVTRDVALSSYKEEVVVNGGKSPKIKLKGYQEFGLFDFDVSLLKGRKITGATLHVHPAGGMKHGGDERGTDLRWFTVTTVSSDWEEGLGATDQADAAGKGASFVEAKLGERPWSYRGSKVFDVTMGNGESIRCDVDAGDPKKGWVVIPVDAKLVQALVNKSSHGLLLMDGSVLISANCYVASRESKTAPFLTVLVDGEDKQAPQTPAEVMIEPAPLDAYSKTGAAKVTLTVPEGAFSYDVKVNGEALPRWQTPFATKAGTKQSFLLEYLPPAGDIKLEIAAVDGAGNASPFAAFSGKASGTITVPKLPESDWKPVGLVKRTFDGKLETWAFPEICKVDPLTGKIALENGMDDFQTKNSVYDGATATIRIVAARGEIAGFQLGLKTMDGAPDVAGISVKVAGLDGIQSKLWRTWFVKVKDGWQADYAIPMKADEALAIPAADNKIEKQKAAVVAIDLIVPADAKPGEHTGTLSVALAGGGEQKLAIKLLVHSAVIPAEMNFIPEMNCYRGPLGDAGTPEFFDAFKIAHYHRSTINRVPHSHNGRTHEDWVPKVDDAGRVTDWSSFDKNLGPLLDGSLFKDNPRAGVPVPALYLPFNESWPLPIKPNYNPGKNIPLLGDGWRAKHDILARPPEQAFNQNYKDAFANCVRDFVSHFEEKNWNRTLAECYNNNKAQNGNITQLGKDGKPIKKDGKNVTVKGMTGTAWTLDEPSSLLDWQALKFYSQLFHKGLDGVKKTKFVYRGDISRPHWQGNYMDGLMEVMVSGGALFNMMPLMKDHRRRMPAMIMAYGACNTQDRSNHETTAWVLKAYTHECDGVVPWQSIGDDNAFDRGDFTGPNGTANNALIVNGKKRFGINAIASFRVHAFRAGAQIAELLRLLEQKNKWSRSHSLALVSQVVPLSAEYTQKFEDDAAALMFNQLNGDDIVRLKEGVLKLLD